ncbi:hypothetical protein ACQKKX_07700 [Neorhizobium sp. NPDC001467]
MDRETMDERENDEPVLPVDDQDVRLFCPWDDAFRKDFATTGEFEF